MGGQRRQGVSKGSQKGSLGPPEGRQGDARGAQRAPGGRQGGTRGCQGEAGGLGGHHGTAEESPLRHQERRGAAKGGKMGAQRNQTGSQNDLNKSEDRKTKTGDPTKWKS